MRAIALDYERRALVNTEIAEPQPPQAGRVLFRIREVGVCGTDRDLATFRFGFPPNGERFLVLGHEALGQVVETGAGVAGIAKGDWVAPFVRRPCSPACVSCARGRRDLCVRPQSLERGIFGLHGYFTEYAVDAVPDLVPVPSSLVDYGVLVEPLSVVEKAVETALRIHEPCAGKALVLGAGPIGLLAALALQARGLEVSVHSLEPAGHPRARLMEVAGMRYREKPEAASADVIIEATGSAEAAFQALHWLAPLGVLGVLGAPNATGPVPFLNMLVRNQAIFGSVNASPAAFAAAVADLGRFDKRVLGAMIRRERFERAFDTIAHAGEAVKTVHVVGD